jgi:hypothetical protein
MFNKQTKDMSQEELKSIGNLLVKNSPADIDKLVGSLAIQLTYHYRRSELYRYLNPIFFLGGLSIGYFIGVS